MFRMFHLDNEKCCDVQVFDPPTASILGEILKDSVADVLKNSARKVDFNSTSPLIAMTNTIMNSKACSISNELRASLSMKIVEGFLRSVPRQADKQVDAITVLLIMFVKTLLSPFSFQNSASKSSKAKGSTASWLAATSTDGPMRNSRI